MLFHTHMIYMAYAIFALQGVRFLEDHRTSFCESTTNLDSFVLLQTFPDGIAPWNSTESNSGAMNYFGLGDVFHPE